MKHTIERNVRDTHYINNLRKPILYSEILPKYAITIGLSIVLEVLPPWYFIVTETAIAQL